MVSLLEGVFYSSKGTVAPNNSNSPWHDYIGRLVEAAGLPDYIRQHRRELLRRWKQSLQEASQSLESNPKARSSGKGNCDFWEGPQAIKELSCLGYLDRIVEPRDADIFQLFEILLREIEIYCENYDLIIEANREFSHRRDGLQRVWRILRTLDSESRLTRPVISPVDKHIEREIECLHQKKQRFWSDSLNYTTQDLLHPFVIVGSLDDTEGRLEYVLPAVAGELDYTTFGWKIPQNPITRANLDTRLQIRLAILFRLRLTGITWRTASRLVLLTYICGRLAGEQDDRMVIRSIAEDDTRERELTVEKIEKKIYKSHPDPDLDPLDYFLGDESI